MFVSGTDGFRSGGNLPGSRIGGGLGASTPFGQMRPVPPVMPSHISPAPKSGTIIGTDGMYSRIGGSVMGPDGLYANIGGATVGPNGIISNIPGMSVMPDGSVLSSTGSMFFDSRGRAYALSGNVLIGPDGSMWSGVSPEDVPMIIDSHDRRKR